MKILSKIIYSFILIAIYLCLSGFVYDNDLPGFKAIHITSIWQVPLINGEVTTLNHSTDLIYSKDYIVLRWSYERITNYFKVNKEGEASRDSSTLDTGYAFYVCKRGESYGLRYDSLSVPTGKRFFVDSLVKHFLDAPAFFYGLRPKSLDSVTVIKDEKKGILIEKFLNKRLSISDPDSSYFYYTNKQLDFPFLIKEKRADKMKLYKANIIYNTKPKGTDPTINYEIKEHTFSFEITEIDIPNKEGIKKLIDRFKSTLKESEVKK